MQSNFRLVMRSGPSVGKEYPLDKKELFIGRDLSNDVVINDPEISRRHARMFLEGNGYILEDLGSTNGTFVNGQRLMGPNVLRPGDVITFGERISMVYESSDFDQDATVVSPASRPSYGNPEPAQIYTAPPQAYPPPQQPYNPPPPGPQAPAQPPYTPPQPSGYQPQAYPPPPSQAGQLPPDSYAGQIPSAYNPEEAAGLPRRRFPTPLIIALVIVLLLCLCASPFVIRYLWNAPLSFWCQFPVWPAGACP